MRIAPLALPLVLACTTPQLEWLDEAGYRWRVLDVPARGAAGFRPMEPGRTGLLFVNAVADSALIANRHLAHGAGVALGDVDGDGRVDIYLGSTSGPNALYMNRGDWRFVDEARPRGLALGDRHTTGVAWADVDGDGDLDLVLAALGGPNAVFLNDGTGRFHEAPGHGLHGEYGSTTPALADADGDGDLDLYIANYKVATIDDLLPPDQRTFDRVVVRRGARFEVVPGLRRHYRVVVRPELDAVVRSERADPDQFYLNDGAGRFVAVALTSDRFRDAGGERLAEPPDYFGLAARFTDVNGDGHPDLYVCNDFEDPDLFWLNDGTGGFQLAPPLAVRSTSNSSMAVDFADVNRDGYVDFFVAEMLAQDLAHRKRQRPAAALLPKIPGGGAERLQWQRNTLQLSRGDGTFSEVAAYAGVAASGWSWGALFLDADLDGYEDLFVTTGHVWDLMDADAQGRSRRAALAGDWRRARLFYPPLRLPNVAYRNAGDGTFRDVSDAWNVAGPPDIAHGIAAGDLDGDGDLDLVITRLNAPPLVLRNESRAPRVAVRLVGRAPNTQAVGAVVTVTAPGLPPQQKEVTAGGLYLSHADYLLSFATGGADTMTLRVRWRAGHETVLPAARPNRLYEIREPPSPTGSPSGADGSAAGPLFEDQSALLGGHRHHEEPFDDYARQPLLPYALSLLGPGVSWFDADGDGYEDLFVPSGRGGQLAYLRNDRGRGFIERPLPLGPAEGDQSAVLGYTARLGERRLLVTRASYEAPSPEAAAHNVAVHEIALGTGRTRAVSAPGPDSPGPLALGDLDGDGALELFVGGRVLPGAYPLPATSHLYHRSAGRWVPDTTNADVLRSIGLVSAALISDLDGDGAPELVVALEWGPIRVWRMAAGRLTELTAQWGLDAWPGRWWGLASGDVDGDGRLELVATGWGENTLDRPSAARPFTVVAQDLDRNGSLEVLIAEEGPAGGPPVPLWTDYRRLIQAVPGLAARFSSAAAYAGATLDDLLPAGARWAYRAQAKTQAHMVFRWEQGRYAGTPLPPAAQLAPALGLAIADLDGDGAEDVLLAQNFFPTELGAPRYDAGRGLVLRGDGRGGLAAVPAGESGITVWGDGRGVALADFDHDGRLDVAITQNAAPTRLFRNTRAEPGVRVRVIGPPGNPDAIGAQVRMVYGEKRGPTREVSAGSGYWSQSSSTLVLGPREGATGVWVRWPHGPDTVVTLAAGQSSLTIAHPPRPR